LCNFNETWFGVPLALTCFANWRELNSQVNGVALPLALRVGGRAGVAAPMASSHFLQHQRLVAHNDALGGVGLQFAAFKVPPNLANWWRRSYDAFKVDVVAFLNVRVTKIASQPKCDLRNICRKKKTFQLANVLNSN